MSAPPFSDADPQQLADGLRLSVTRLARLMRQQSDTDLTLTQMAALATLDRAGPMPMGTLAEHEQIGAPTVTKIVDKLHAAGLVDRLPDERDRRVIRLAITPSGHTVLSEVRARKTAWLTERLAALPATELATVADAIALLEHLTTPDRRAAQERRP